MWPLPLVSQRWRGRKDVWTFVPFASSLTKRAEKSFAVLVIDKAFLEEMRVATIFAWKLFWWSRWIKGKNYGGMNEKTVIFLLKHAFSYGIYLLLIIIMSQQLFAVEDWKLNIGSSSWVTFGADARKDIVKKEVQVFQLWLHVDEVVTSFQWAREYAWANLRAREQADRTKVKDSIRQVLMLLRTFPCPLQYEDWVNNLQNSL